MTVILITGVHGPRVSTPGRMMKIQVYVSTNRVGSKCSKIVDVDDEGWSEMDDRERDEYMRDEMFSMIEWGYDEVA